MFVTQTIKTGWERVGFTSRKAKHKPSLIPRKRETRIQQVKEKLSWTLHGIYIGQGDDAGTFFWCKSSETYKDEPSQL